MNQAQTTVLDQINNLVVDLSNVAKRNRTLGARDDAAKITEGAAMLSQFAGVLRTSAAVADAKAGVSSLVLAE